MPDLSDTAAYPIQLQLAFYFCLFGFFGTIISTSVFLKWQQYQLTINNTTSTLPQNQKQQPQQQQYKPVNNNINNQMSIANKSCSNINVYPQITSSTPPLTPTTRSYPLLPPYHIYNNTQIFLDWDDTLFPTAYTLLNMKNGKTNSNDIDVSDWNKLDQLTQIIYNLLLLYIQLFGAHNICIVTNAKLSWWNESCTMYNKLYSKIYHLFTNIYNIQIISAYDIYHKQKSCAFMDILYPKNNISQVISIGDSDDEYNAIHTVTNILKQQRNINYYRFKLLQSPSLNAMCKQLYSMQKLDYHIIAQQTYDQSYQFH